MLDLITLKIHLSPHSSKFASRLNLHLERENIRINNFMTLFSQKITSSHLTLYSFTLYFIYIYI